MNGYLLFEEWCSKSLKKHPKEQFFNYLFKEKKKLEKYGLFLKHKRGGDECWLDQEKTTANSNLLHARDNYNLALLALEAGNISSALEKLKSAIAPTGYSGLKFPNAFNLLAEVVSKLNYKNANISETLLQNITSVLWHHKRRLSDALFTIKEVYIKSDLLDENSIEYEMSQLEAELKRTSENYEAISRKVPISEKVKDYQEIVNLITQLREGLIFLEEKGVAVDEKICDYPAFTNLKDNQYVRPIIDEAVCYLREKDPGYFDKEAAVDYLFLQVTRRNTFSKHNNLSAIRQALHKKLTGEIDNLVNAGRPLKERLVANPDQIGF